MTTPESLDEQLERIFAARDRDDMAPTINAFLAVLAEHPEDPAVLYEVGGSYDTAGEEEVAADYYRRAIDGGLDGYRLRQCYLQFGSTLRNMGLYDDSLAMIDMGLARFPESESLGIFRALTLHDAGKTNAALGSLLILIADRFRTDEVVRYEAALRGNGSFLESLDDVES